MNRLTRLSLVAVTVPVILVGVACGGSSDSKTTTSSSTASAGLDVAPKATTAPGATVAPASGTTTAIAKLNLNTASGDDYKRVIPNFPDRFVKEFLEYKPYVSIKQFRTEMAKYIGAQQIADWEKYVFVPVDPNNSDADTLKQLPKVDDTVAGQLIAARPYANNDAFMAKLSQLVPGIDQASAKAMLKS